MREHWQAHGPPLNVAAVAIAAALGVDLIGGGSTVATGKCEGGEVRGLSIPELEATANVGAGQDTRLASSIIVKRWSGTE